MTQWYCLHIWVQECLLNSCPIIQALTIIDGIAWKKKIGMQNTIRIGAL